VYPAPVGGKQIAVQVFAQGQDGDWSNTAVQPNDGLALLRYPKGSRRELHRGSRTRWHAGRFGDHHGRLGGSHVPNPDRRRRPHPTEADAAASASGSSRPGIRGDVIRGPFPRGGMPQLPNLQPRGVMQPIPLPGLNAGGGPIPLPRPQLPGGPGLGRDVMRGLPPDWLNALLGGRQGGSPFQGDVIRGQAPGGWGGFFPREPMPAPMPYPPGGGGYQPMPFPGAGGGGFIPLPQPNFGPRGGCDDERTTSRSWRSS
jgi:hypothetical protein